LQQQLHKWQKGNCKERSTVVGDNSLVKNKTVVLFDVWVLGLSCRCGGTKTLSVTGGFGNSQMENVAEAEQKLQLALRSCEYRLL